MKPPHILIHYIKTTVCQSLSVAVIPDRHRFAYNHCLSMEANLQSVNEKLEGMEEYQAEVQEESYISGLHR